MRAAAESIDVRQELVSLLPKLRRFASTLARDPGDADDLLHDVCERAVSRSHLWSGEARLESWIYAMTRNLWTEELKKRGIRSDPGPLSVGRNTVGTAQSGEKTVYNSPLQQMILSMPNGHASVFVLVTIEGHSYREAAEILRIPIGTVMGQLSAARMRLAAMQSETAGKKASPC